MSLLPFQFTLNPTDSCLPARSRIYYKLHGWGNANSNVYILIAECSRDARRTLHEQSAIAEYCS